MLGSQGSGRCCLSSRSRGPCSRPPHNSWEALAARAKGARPWGAVVHQAGRHGEHQQAADHHAGRQAEHARPRRARTGLDPADHVRADHARDASHRVGQRDACCCGSPRRGSRAAAPRTARSSSSRPSCRSSRRPSPRAVFCAYATLAHKAAAPTTPATDRCHRRSPLASELRLTRIIATVAARYGMADSKPMFSGSETPLAFTMVGSQADAIETHGEEEVDDAQQQHASIGEAVLYRMQLAILLFGVEVFGSRPSATCSATCVGRLVVQVEVGHHPDHTVGSPSSRKSHRQPPGRASQ